MPGNIEVDCQIDCAHHRLGISPAGLQIDSVRFALVGANTGLKIEQVGAILMAGIINLKFCVIQTDVNRIAGLHIAVNIVMAFMASSIGSTRQVQVMKIVACNAELNIYWSAFTVKVSQAF